MGTSVGRNSNRMFCFEVVCINVKVYIGDASLNISVHTGQVKILPGHGGN